MRVCLIYDCLFPYTVGGAERWYRNLGERLAAEGHEVDYLTLRQWERGVAPDVAGISVRAVGPRMRLYAGPGRRRILPPLVFGLGVFWHLLWHGRRYNVVHTASFPYFSLLAAGFLRPLGGYRLLVDWHEVWTRSYWREYLGLLGDIGWLIQRMCVRLPHRSFCFSRLHASRLEAEGLRGEVTTLPGEYGGPVAPAQSKDPQPIVMFAGRHIPEKQVPTIPPAILKAREEFPELRALILGDGPERSRLVRLVTELGLDDVVEVPGFVSSREVEHALANAACLLLPSRREGYGMVIVEAARHGTPTITVAGPDNAAVELIEDGTNGFVAESSSPVDLSEAISKVRTAGSTLRVSTAEWFEQNAHRLSIRSSLDTIVTAYRRG